MKHAIVAPTHLDARRLAHVITREGWHSRVTHVNGFTVVLAHAPRKLVNAACRAISFQMGRAR